MTAEGTMLVAHCFRIDDLSRAEIALINGIVQASGGGFRRCSNYQLEFAAEDQPYPLDRAGPSNPLSSTATLTPLPSNLSTWLEPESPKFRHRRWHTRHAVLCAIKRNPALLRQYDASEIEAWLDHAATKTGGGSS